MYNSHIVVVIHTFDILTRSRKATSTFMGSSYIVQQSDESW
ncbi:MAG TPA: hypothetical protein ACFE0H_02170 [Elainellaceae cyanobacterium]